MAATISTVSQARLRMRPVQRFVHLHWTSGSYEQKLMITRELMPSLLWWGEPENLSQGRPFQPPPPDLVITTDASIEGWGGHLNVNGQNLLFSGLWSRTERQRCHINLLELRAIKLTMLQCLPHITNRVVKVECDNTTAVSYLNRQGGTRSWVLCQEACSLHEWMLLHNVTASAVHRPGVDNQLADYLSRNRPDPNEWSLSDHQCQRLWSMWGRPQLDLFASPLNHKLPLWFSRTRCDGAAGADAFTQSWTGLSIYAFPPRNLLLKTLLKIREDQVEEAIVIAPHWPKRVWFPLLMEMATTKPHIFPVERGLLSQVLPEKGRLFHPDLLTLQLSAWKLSAKSGT